MKFPIETKIEPVGYGPINVSEVLRVDGNAGQIPCQFQCSVLTSPANGSKLCDQSVTPMIDDQWDAWLDQENAEYILDCMAANLGLTRIKAAPVEETPEEAAAPKRKTRR